MSLLAAPPDSGQAHPTDQRALCQATLQAWSKKLKQGSQMVRTNPKRTWGSRKAPFSSVLCWRLECSFPALMLNNHSGTIKNDQEGHSKVKSLKEQLSPARDSRGTFTAHLMGKLKIHLRGFYSRCRQLPWNIN